MNNKNMLKFKKVNEERYFKNYNELFDFVLKNRHQSEEQFYNSVSSHESVNKEVLIPLLEKSQHRLAVIGNFICLISEGCFNRASGMYKYNILAVQNRLNLCHNDMRKLFNY